MDITPRQKVAIILLNLDRTTAATVLRTFSHNDILELGATMSKMEEMNMDKATIERVLREFLTKAGESRSIGEISSKLFGLLQEALGDDKAQEIINQLKSEGRIRPFEDLRGLDNNMLGAILGSEHPQTAALTLANLGTEKASEILKTFPNDKQFDIIERLLTLEEAPIDIMEQIAEMILAKSTIGMQDRFIKQDFEDRVKNIAEILNSFEETNCRKILDKLGEKSKEMAQQIEDHLFVFADLLPVTQRDIRKILTQVETKKIAYALKGCSREVMDHILGALSSRIRQVVIDEKDILGAVPIHEVTEAQREILRAAREMHDAGQIQLRKSSKGSEMQMVE